MRLPRLVAGALAVAFLVSPSLAADRAIIILDGSGSMWAQIEGEPRILIARETLSEVLDGIPAEIELGFMSYGHRERGNCDDIEMMVTPQAGTADAIREAANAINPLGKTPITEAVRQAAEGLRYTEDKATVILITDGIETCNADPCALAGELERVLKPGGKAVLLTSEIGTLRDAIDQCPRLRLGRHYPINILGQGATIQILDRRH